MVQANYWTGEPYPPYIKEAKAIYVPGDEPKDVMWTVVNINENITLAKEQDELLALINEYWWYIVGNDE
jgi:hypothetical protein